MLERCRQVKLGSLHQHPQLVPGNLLVPAPRSAASQPQLLFILLENVTPWLRAGCYGDGFSTRSAGPSLPLPYQRCGVGAACACSHFCGTPQWSGATHAYFPTHVLSCGRKTASGVATCAGPCLGTQQGAHHPWRPLPCVTAGWEAVSPCWQPKQNHWISAAGAGVQHGPASSACSPLCPVHSKAPL